jgi:hypothetical protein
MRVKAPSEIRHDTLPKAPTCRWDRILETDNSDAPDTAWHWRFVQQNDAAHCGRGMTGRRSWFGSA